MTDSWTTTLLKGIAEYLHDQGVGNYVEDQNEPIGDVFNPLILGPVPSAPDVVIGLVPYSPGGDDPGQPEVTQMVQIWIRGDDDRDTAVAIGDELFEALHGADTMTFGGIPCPFVARRSVVPMGRDGAGRWEFAHNYAFTASHPTPFTND